MSNPKRIGPTSQYGLVASRTRPRRFRHAQYFLLFLPLLSILSSPASTFASTQWRLVSPGPRSSHAMAYDSNRNRVIVFGGIAERIPSGPVYFDDTLEWDGNVWQRRNVEDAPGPRMQHAMVFDSARGHVLLFGGYRETQQHYSDTWAWDGATWTRVANTGPSPRYGHAMAYDIARQRVVLFGGHALGTASRETWEWDGSMWALRSDTGPPATVFHAMAYDAGRQRVVLFGGNTTDGISNQVWEWDGKEWSHRGSGGPSARAFHSLVYDDVRGEVLLFAGLGGDLRFGDTWSWDGTVWTQLASGGAGSRYAHAAAYDTSRSRAVLFGGNVHISGPSDERKGDTWEWVNNSWALRRSNGPIARTESALAYDSRRNRTVLFGGSHGGYETWELDGTTWFLRSTTGPSARRGHAMVFDSLRDRVVLFGGREGSGGLSDTWEWDGTTWTLRATVGPSARSGHAMSFDSARGRTVLHGGSNGVGETWEWDGQAWSLASYLGPSDRTDSAMSFDSQRQRTVLFGGDAGFQDSNEAWDWDGVAWHSRGNNGPSPRWGHGMAYNSASRVVVVFGGVNGAAAGDTWEWDGVSLWALTATAAQGPGAQYDHTMAFDSSRQRIVLFSGVNSSGFEGETWEYVDCVEIVSDPGDTVVCIDSPAVLHVVAFGSPPITYQWYRDDMALYDDARLTGATTPTLTVWSPVAGDSGSYHCVVGGACGGASSASAALVVTDTPQLSTDLSALQAITGETVAFEAMASSAAVVSYQWQRDNVDLIDGPTPAGSDIAGATTSMLQISNVQTDDAGLYRVRAANVCGASTSSSALLTVVPPPCPGDLNCDGVFDFFDIDPFVVALFQRSNYALLYPDCDVTLADLTGDGFVDFFDIDAFVLCLFGSCPPCP